MHVRVEHTFERVSVEQFVDVYYSADFNQAVAPLASLRERELIEEEELSGGKIRRRVRMVPDVKLPGPIARLVQNAPINYFEVSTYDPVEHAALYRIESAAGEAIQVRGKVSFEPAGTGVLRRIEGDVDVNIFGIGRLIEKLIAQEVAGRYDKIQAFTQRWIDEKVKAI